MKKTFFPNTILQIIGLLFFSIAISTPFMHIINRNYTGKDMQITIFYVLFTLIFIGLTHIINWERGFYLTYNFKLINIKILSILILTVLLFEFGINTTFASFLAKLVRNPLPSFVMAFGAVVIGPIVEEIIFRGIILRGLLTRYSPKKAIIISAIIFGVLHGKLTMVFPGIILGLFFGWLYYKTKTIGITIILHALANLFAFISSFFLYELKIYDNKNLFNAYRILIIIISLILIFILKKILIIQFKKVKLLASK